MRNDMSPEAEANYQALGGALLETWRESVPAPARRRRSTPICATSPGAVAAAGGDMRQGRAGRRLVDKLADRRAVRSAARRARRRGRRTPRAATSRIKLDSYIDDTVDTDPDGRSASSRSPATIVDGKAPPGTAGGDSIAEAIEKGLRDDGLKALVVRVDSPGGSVHGVRTHPPGAARRQGEEIAGRRVDGQCRGVGRLLGRDAGRFHLRRAVDDHRVDRRVRHPAELPGNARQARHRRRRDQDDAAVGRARPAPRALARGQPADPGRRSNSIYRRFLGLVAQSRRKSPAESTASRRAACGTAARRASSAWSTASAGWTKRSPRRPSWPSWATSAVCAISSVPKACATDPRDACRRGRGRRAGRRVRGARRPRRKWRSCAAIGEFGRSSPDRDPGPLPRMPAGRADRGCRGRIPGCSPG